MLSEATVALLTCFFLEPKEAFEKAVAERSHRELATAMSELLSLYANDRNSSALREWVVLKVAGCEHRPEKIGYNGCKGNVPYEVKPRNVRSGELKQKRLNGDGNFTDFTYERLEKYRSDGVRVLVAGFVDGRLVYILEVPFASLYRTLKKQLDEKFKGERPSGLFLRSANFSFRDYRDDEQVSCLFLRTDWRQYASWLTKEFQNYLARFERG